jgi:hypothetical protein
MPSKRKAPKPSLTFYEPADSSDEERTSRHKFLRFDVSASGNISSITTYHSAPASPVKRGSLPALTFHDDPIPEPDFMPTLLSNGTYLDPAYVDHLGENVENPLGIKRARVQSVCTFFMFPEAINLLQLQDNPLRCWQQSEITLYLEEMIRLEGRGGETICFRCGSGEAVFRCNDCLGAGLWCQPCLLVDHMRNPLHRIEVR